MGQKPTTEELAPFFGEQEIRPKPLPESVERCDTLPQSGHDGRTRAAVPESADEELARLRRLAIVEELLTTLVGVLDVREVFAQVSEVTGRVLKHDAIALPVITEDRQHVIPVAMAGPAAVEYPSSHPIPESERYLLKEPWEFEIVDDLQADPDRERHSASLVSAPCYVPRWSSY